MRVPSPRVIDEWNGGVIIVASSEHDTSVENAVAATKSADRVMPVIAFRWISIQTCQKK
jgi:hypothetical protein